MCVFAHHDKSWFVLTMVCCLNCRLHTKWLEKSWLVFLISYLSLISSYLLLSVLFQLGRQARDNIYCSCRFKCSCWKQAMAHNSRSSYGFKLLAELVSSSVNGIVKQMVNKISTSYTMACCDL